MGPRVDIIHTCPGVCLLYRCKKITENSDAFTLAKESNIMKEGEMRRYMIMPLMEKEHYTIKDIYALGRTDRRADVYDVTAWKKTSVAFYLSIDGNKPLYQK